MDWLKILQDIFSVCIVPLLAVLTAFLVIVIKAKMKQIAIKTDNELASKYILLLSDTISDCVIATNQTYVEALKDKDIFTKEAQLEAFQMTYDAVMNILSDEAKNYLENIYGDLDSYVKEKIEANLKYPGTIKIVVVRETRAQEEAK